MTYCYNMNNNIYIQALIILLSIFTLTSCKPSVPKDAKQQHNKAVISPDEDGATIPPNIAPINFRIQTDGDDYITRIYTAKGKEYLTGGKDVIIPIDSWRDLLNEAKGGALFVDIYVKRDGLWLRYPSVKYDVAKEDIDPYVTYRLIEPSYVDYEDLTINQRNITNFDENVIFDNTPLSDGDNGQCINCHSCQNYNKGGRMQMHVRQNLGGTVIVENGKAVKVGLEVSETLSAGVYPAWHPTENLIAYSVNATGQVFHTKDLQKVEVLDFASDIILYDVAKNRIFTVSNKKDEFESFPTWSPDGKTLYYISAHFVQKTDNIDAELDLGYKNLKYNIYSRSFNPRTRKFGEQRLVFDASALGKSASVPRVSPDGKYLLFSLADYGQFHIWHKSSDLFVLDLRTKACRPLSAANSPATDSFHNWSSNGRWILFTSRRDDGNYSRIYFSYFDNKGIAHKAFVLPQKQPDYYTYLFKSYNVPEFIVRPITISRSRLLDAVKKESDQATYGGNLSNDNNDNSDQKVKSENISGRRESVKY